MKPPRLVLGIEAGGTKTECAALSESGLLFGYGRGGPANLNFVTEEQHNESLRTAVEGALKDQDGQVCAVGYTIAGTAASIKWLRRRLGNPVLWHYSELRVAVAITGLINPHGVAVIAGTGSNVAFFKEGEQLGSVGGWGSLLGDEGSAYEVALQAIRAAVRAYDGRDPDTALVQAVQRYFNVEELRSELVPLFYKKTLPRHQIASFAKEAVKLAEEQRDKTAIRVVQQAAERLAQDAVTGAKAYFDPADPVSFSLSGGMFHSKRCYLKAFEEVVQAVYPLAKFRLPRDRPATAVARITLRDWLKVNR